MAKIAKYFKLSDVKVGDVFVCMVEEGCRSAGELLVVTGTFPEGDVVFARSESQDVNYGMPEWLESEINAQRIRYVGSLKDNSLLAGWR